MTPSSSTAPTGGQSITVSGATITYNDRWIFDTVNSTPDSHTFWDAADGSGTWYGYLPTVPTSGDAAAQLATFNTQYFEGTFQNIQQVALEPISPTTAWALTTAEYNSEPAAVLTYVDTSVSGQQRVQMLMGTADTLQASLADVQQSVQIDGVGTFNGVDSTRIGTLVDGGAPVGQTPAAVATTPATVPSPVTAPTATTVAASTTPVPAGQQGGPLTQTATAGANTVTYGADWELDAANSSAEAVILRYASDPNTNFGYLQGADRESGGDVRRALQIFDFPYAFAATNSQELASETLPSGRAYAVYAWEREGASEVALFLVDVTTTPGTFRM
jgi:hypothetical protein